MTAPINPKARSVESLQADNEQLRARVKELEAALRDCVDALEPFGKVNDVAFKVKYDGFPAYTVRNAKSLLAKAAK